MTTETRDIVSRFVVLRDSAYFAYIDQSRKYECLGWEAKLKHGKFGSPELEAHKLAAEWLGKHRAYAHAVSELNDALKAEAVARERAELAASLSL